MRAGRSRIRKLLLPFICMSTVAAIIAGSTPSAQAGIWNSKLTLQCQAGGNSCTRSTGLVPAGKVITIRHLSCSFLVYVANEDPLVLLRRLNSAGTLIVEESFLPVFAGARVASLLHIVNSPTLFYVPGGYKASVAVVTKNVDKLASATCYLSGDISP